VSGVRAPNCPLPHLAPGNTQVGIEEYLSLRSSVAVADERARAATERADGAEKREQVAQEERRESDAARSAAEERATRADQGRAEALSKMAEVQASLTQKIADAVQHERASAETARANNKTGITEENQQLAKSLENAHAINRELLGRLTAAMDLLDAERVAHGKLRASRPDVAIAADVATKELEGRRLDAEVKRLEIVTNKEVADRCSRASSAGSCRRRRQRSTACCWSGSRRSRRFPRPSPPTRRPDRSMPGWTR
jgi:hypothetical protein